MISARLPDDMRGDLAVPITEELNRLVRQEACNTSPGSDGIWSSRERPKSADSNGRARLHTHNTDE